MADVLQKQIDHFKDLFNKPVNPSRRELLKAGALTGGILLTTGTLEAIAIKNAERQDVSSIEALANLDQISKDLLEAPTQEILGSKLMQILDVLVGSKPLPKGFGYQFHASYERDSYLTEWADITITFDEKGMVTVYDSNETEETSDPGTIMLENPKDFLDRVRSLKLSSLSGSIYSSELSFTNKIPQFVTDAGFEQPDTFKFNRQYTAFIESTGRVINTSTGTLEFFSKNGNAYFAQENYRKTFNPLKTTASYFIQRLSGNKPNTMKLNPGQYQEVINTLK